jgi:predicted ATPase/class 3 adenylate cyclase
MDLPSGTITFLFTDIEGSTKLWEEQPDTMRLALARHDALLRAAIETNGGVVFKTMGDAFCAAFPTAPQALEAAQMVQQSLRQVKVGIGSDLMLKVRMALHTGTAEQRDGDYFGQPLNRVARLLAIGHGGQILLSQTTYDLSRDVLPTEASLKDLGQHRLKDLTHPEQIWQMLHPDLPADFPPLRSLDNPLLPNNLPRQITSFVGREKEIEDIKERIKTAPLLTLTGSGGCGKTRLSLQVAAEVLDSFPDGVWLVELAPLSDPALVPQTVAEVVSVRESPGESIIKTLVGALKEKRLLLVLDNCEHVLESSARLVDAILKACPKVKILVSSREALGIGGEGAYRVPSLSLPNLQQLQTPESLSHSEAVHLFIERAITMKADFAVTNQDALALASVCHRLDGVPLAIELAAARVRSLTVEELGRRLDDRFRLLTGGSRTALPRQQTLRATIDWSYDLLEENQKALLARLSVFVGGWTLEACERVCIGNGIESWEVLDLLTALVDKSLVIAEEREGMTRYRLLEMIRQYAREKLASQTDSETYRRMHRDYFLVLAEEAEPKLHGNEQAHWLDVLETEHENVRQALTFCLEEPGQAQAGLTMAGALQHFWLSRGYLSEGRERTMALLTHPDAQQRTPARRSALNGAGLMARDQGDYDSARSLHEECLGISRELGDKRNIAGSLHNLGILARSQGDYEKARSLCEEALAINQETGNRRWQAANLVVLGGLAQSQGDYAAAQLFMEQSLSLQRELGDALGVAGALNNLGRVNYDQGNYRVARMRMEESLAIRRELKDKNGVANSLMSLGRMNCDQGDYAMSRAQFEESLAIQRDLGDRYGSSWSLTGLGNVACSQGDYAIACSVYQEALVIRQELGNKRDIELSLQLLASLDAKENRLEHAARLWAALEHLHEEIASPLSPDKREEYDRDVAAARQVLGEERFSAAWAEGRAMTLEQAIACALEERGKANSTPQAN